MSTDTSPTQAVESPLATKASAPASPVLHRVCIQCNNMFRVTPDKYDAKHCPACHKG